MVDKPRLPYDDLPQDNVCPECGQVCKSALGLRAHCRSKHNIEWEHKPDAVRESFKAKHGIRDYKEITKTEDLKHWQKLAIIHHYLLNRPWAEVEKFVGKGERACAGIYNSPAGQQFRDELDNELQDTKDLLHIVFNASLLGLAAQDAAALQMAVEERDYNFIHEFAKDHYKWTGTISESKDSEQAAPILNIHIEGSLDTPRIATSHKVLEAEVIDEESG